MAADLRIMGALDWDEGELLDQHSAICASDWSLVEVVEGAGAEPALGDGDHD